MIRKEISLMLKKNIQNANNMWELLHGSLFCELNRKSRIVNLIGNDLWFIFELKKNLVNVCEPRAFL